MSGDQDADPLDVLRKYRDWLRLLAQMQVGNRYQAKFDPSDAVQQTMLEAVRAWPQFRGESDAALAAWLRQILARVLAHEFRRFAGVKARDLARGLSRPRARRIVSAAGRGPGRPGYIRGGEAGPARAGATAGGSAGAASGGLSGSDPASQHGRAVTRGSRPAHGPWGRSRADAVGPGARATSQRGRCNRGRVSGRSHRGRRIKHSGAHAEAMATLRRHVKFLTTSALHSRRRALKY